MREDMERHDPRLVEVVEVLGDDASGFCADLKITNISTSMYRIKEFDGKEKDEPSRFGFAVHASQMEVVVND